MPEEPTRVLVFSAHAADFCSRSGATLAKHARRGDQVRVVALTFGERGESPALWTAQPDRPVVEVKAIRRAEAEAAAAVLGVEIEFLDWDDYPLIVEKDRLLRLVDEIRSFRPRLLLTHWLRDEFNQDHKVAAQAVVRACSLAETLGLRTGHPPTGWPRVLFFEPTVPNTEFNDFKPNLYVDVTDAFDQKLAALAQIRAQPFLADWYTEYARRRAWQARSLGGDQAIVYAEAFLRYRPEVSAWLDG